MAFYGTGRLWNEPRASFKSKKESSTSRLEKSRFTGYSASMDPRLSVRQLTDWVAQQAWISFSEQRQTKILGIVLDAIKSCVENATDIRFDPRLNELAVSIKNTTQPFSNLSDGQRCIAALIGDLAQRTYRLNPHFGVDALTKTGGIVLIDELDLHLHPKWQRQIIENLRTTFPSLQFFCTTHSPFLIQSLRSGDEMVVLDGDASSSLANKSIEEIATEIQGVNLTHVSNRYQEMKASADRYLELLSESKTAPTRTLTEYKDALTNLINPFTENPAFQAILEFERKKEMGSDSMRPVRRGACPAVYLSANYHDARDPLVDRIGMYCSYCERRIVSAIHVEHIQPKTLPQNEGLIHDWSNFLLACSNCNSTKGSQDIDLDEVLLPDRDNTSAALMYEDDGTIRPSQLAFDLGVADKAHKLLEITGNIRPQDAATLPKTNRFTQRMEIWLTAKHAKAGLEEDPQSTGLKDTIVKLARASGFFSVWFTVFEDHPEMKSRFVRAFEGTQESGCFDGLDCSKISPSPNHDQLPSGGRI